MTTDTDFHLVQELRSRYAPAQRGIVDAAETRLIRSVLQLGQRTDIEVQNIRDVSVMIYGQAAANETDPAKSVALMDAMSAVTAVIDEEKGRRGMPV